VFGFHGLIALALIGETVWLVFIKLTMKAGRSDTAVAGVSSGEKPTASSATSAAARKKSSKKEE
jgi:hypothetical protein